MERCATWHVARCMLHVAWRGVRPGTLHAACSMLHGQVRHLACCMLHVACCMWHCGQCTLHGEVCNLANVSVRPFFSTWHVARGMLHVARCTLHVAWRGVRPGERECPAFFFRPGTLHVASFMLHVARCMERCETWRA